MPVPAARSRHPAAANKVTGKYFVAYVPPGFRTLAFAADEVVEYPASLCAYSTYSEVNETVSGSGIRSGVIGVKFRSAWLWTLYKCRIRNSALMTALRLWATPRAIQFFYRSGISRWATQDAGARFADDDLRIMLVGDFTEVVGDDIRLTRPDLMDSFHRRFSRLATAISEGLTLSTSASRRDQLLIRTRNYTHKAPVHNTNESAATNVARCALEQGLSVVNVGSPPMRLEIEHAQYGESNHELDLDGEACLWGSPIATQGDAGLFTLVSCVDQPLCILSIEWSESVFPTAPISLLSARRLRDEGRLHQRDLGFPDSLEANKVVCWLQGAQLSEPARE